MQHARTISVTPLLVAELLVEGERMPVYVHLVDHPEGRVLIDTGMTERHPALDDMDPVLTPLTEHPLDLATIDAVVATHLHADHCGGNRLFPDAPIHVQRQELTDAAAEGYTLPEWVRPDELHYVAHDGDYDLLPGVRVLACPGHTRGSQIVVIEADGGPVVIAGDAAVWFGQLDEPEDDGQRRILALEPSAVWLSHTHEPWRPPGLQIPAQVTVTPRTVDSR